MLVGKELLVRLLRPSKPFGLMRYDRAVLLYQIGIVDPPTIADMERELEALTNGTQAEETIVADVYVNKTPKEKPVEEFPMKLAMGIGAAVIAVIVGVVICCCCCCSSGRRPRRRRHAHNDSDTSVGTNVS